MRRARLLGCVAKPLCTLVRDRLDVGKAVHKLVALPVGNLEGLVDGVRDGVDAPLARPDGIVDGCGGAVQGSAQPTHAAGGVAQSQVRIERRRERGVDQPRRVPQQGSGGRDERGVAPHCGARRAQGPGTVGDGAVQLARDGRELVVVQVVIQVREGRGTHLEDGVREGLVDGLPNGARGLARDDRRDGVLLLVAIEEHLRAVRVGRERGHHVGAEVLRDHDGGIVLPASDALDGVVLGRDRVADLVARAQLRHDALAYVDAHGDQPAGVAGVRAGKCDLEVPRVAIGVPAAGDVEPGVERRYDDHAHADDQADDVSADVARVASDEAPDPTHPPRPPSAPCCVSGVLSCRARGPSRGA